jgi:hypothetical protein
MKDYMISMFIDDELNLGEKIEFVESVHADVAIKNETLSLLRQEIRIGSPVVARVPGIAVKTRPKVSFAFLRPAATFAAGLAAALVILFFALPEQKISSISYRFVIYQPDVEQVDITGSFNGWNTLPMKKMGTTGYWEITLNLEQGEHRYSYILESDRQIPDPSVMTREKDDFGGQNSILDINLKI